VANTAGLVQQITWVDPIVCVGVGPSIPLATWLFIRFSAADTDGQLAFKKAAVDVLVRAQAAGYPVDVAHAAGGAEIDGIRFGEFDISPVGLAVHDDFYAVTGSAIPPGAELVFETAAVTVTVTPDLVRPHWVFVAQLPSAVPVGRNLVRLEAVGGWHSDSVPIDVVSGPAAVVRVLYSGAPKPDPYAIGFAANPGIVTEAGAYVADPLLTNRPGFHDTVGFCLRTLLTLTEDCLRQGDWDQEMRFVALFDSCLIANDANCVTSELPNSTTMQPRKENVGPFLLRYGVTVDVALVIHGSTTHTRAWTWASVDDPARPGTAYVYDGVPRVHGHYSQTPGSAALWVDMDRTFITPLHESLHGVADFNNGRVVDLYNDIMQGNFMVNKKARARAADPIPAVFATYNGMAVQSDQNRDGLGYLPGWTSYHPSPIDATRPNVMDDYKQIGADSVHCRLDGLTYAFLSDRLRVKLTR
jgi:hypothetical protein